MTVISLRQFDSVEALNQAIAALLRYHFEQEYPFAHAVMLAGGNTPQAAYAQAARAQLVAAKSLHLFLSDERLVPLADAASNFGRLRPLIAGLDLRDQQLLRVNPELAPAEAAGDYAAQLKKFINRGGRITLGLLGLGADGHTASLFSTADLERGRGQYAFASIAPDGVKRVSVTPDLLNKIQQIVFVVSGAAKQPVVDKLLRQPAQVVAGLAVAGVKMKQLWFAAQ